MKKKKLKLKKKSKRFYGFISAYMQDILAILMHSFIYVIM